MARKQRKINRTKSCWAVGSERQVWGCKDRRGKPQYPDINVSSKVIPVRIEAGKGQGLAAAQWGGQ